MEIRLLSLDDFSAYCHIASRAFAHGEPVDMKPEEFMTAERTRLGVFEQGRLQAQYSVLDFSLFFGDDRRPCGGIAGVACEPSARGRGYAGALIDRSLEVMRDRGQYLSLLWPFDHRFYRRHGWDWVGHERHYTVPLSLLENDPEAEHIEPVFESHFEALNPLYERKARQYHGPLVRSAKRWDALLKPHDKSQAASYLYRRDGSAEGFAVIRYDKKRDRARASEFVALTPRAYRAFLTLFKRHSATVQKFVWSVPMDDIFFSLLPHWDVKTRLHPSAMGRIVDLEAAFRALSPDAGSSGSLCLGVVDTHAPWNEGNWRIRWEGGRVDVTAGDTSPAVRIDIGSLSQAYWGTPSLEELRRAGRVDVEDEQRYSQLLQLLPAAPVWLADDF